MKCPDANGERLGLTLGLAWFGVRYLAPVVQIQIAIALGLALGLAWLMQPRCPMGAQTSDSLASKWPRRHARIPNNARGSRTPRVLN